MDRTLYLRECKGLKVRRDGPSLWIRELGKAGRRVPVRLISRVVIIGNLYLESDAITLFAEQGIPVAFLRPSGEVKAVAMAYDCKPENFKDRQRVLQEDDEMRERAIRWMEARRRMFRIETLRRLSPPLAREIEYLGLRELDYHTALRTFCAHDIVVTNAVSRAATGCIHEMVVEKVLRAGLDPHCGVVRTRENFGLCKDFVAVLDPVVDRHVVKFFQGRNVERHIWRNGKAAGLTPAGNRAVVLQLEEQRATMGGMIDSLLDDYYRLLREVAFSDS